MYYINSYEISNIKYMKKFDINTKVKVRRIKLTWNQRLQKRGIPTWQESQRALKLAINNCK